MADDHRPFQEPLPEDGVALAGPIAAHVGGEQRFWAQLMILGAPFFVSVFGALAGFALAHGGTQPGAFLGIFWLVLTAATLR
ncbi:MAG: hypothetical protein QOH28_3550, partial [Actinomycetota bacterium]|nr:hypothetical protein [Actinomycetota bacterium]